MPAAPLAVEWEAVKAHAITHGVREAARAFGLKQCTVMQRSAREGWLRSAREAAALKPQLLPKSMQPRQVSNVSSASEAARNTLERLKEQGKLGLAKAIAKGGKHLGTLPPEQIVERVPAVVGLATAHAKLYPEQQAGPVVAIQLLASPVEHEKAANATAVEHAPVLDLGE